MLDVDSFIEQLCENKDKPEMQCDGKCYLTKITNDTSNEDSNKTPEIKWEAQVYCTIDSSTPGVPLTIPHNKNRFCYILLHNETVVSSIFHPPRYS